jgi:signal transduction histidine kinase
VKVKHSLLPNGQILSLIDPFSEETALTQAHGDFISTISHEFRTPLTSIKGFADTLLQYGSQLPEDEKRRFITIMKEQADRLIRLVENLLTVSKLGANRLDSSYRPVPLQKLIEKVVQSIQAKIRTKNPTNVHRFAVMVHPASLEVWADADRLEQILLNLVDNAVKYSATDSAVTIRAELLPEDENQVRISVQDEGIGIATETLPKIFTQFYRVESPLKQEVEGTGLGLYITRSLTNALGGQLTVESTPGVGSTFSVVFPVATPERQAVYNRRLASEDVRHA